MRLTQLQYFIRVAELGSINAASRDLHVTQPAISTAVRSLEEELGVHLFSRSHQRMELTDAGLLFYGRVRDALRILDDAREKARNILQDAKDYADHTIRTVNKLSSKNGVDMKALEKERTAIRNKLDQSGGKKKKAPEAVRAAQSRPEDFHKGDSVRVVSMNLKGTIISDVNNSGEFMVQMGIMKSHVHYSDLVLTAEELEERQKEKKDSSGSGKIRMEKSMAAASSINLIGQTVDEAMVNLKKYLDDAYLAKLDQVTIIHGRGTGALRKAVQERLRKTKYVKSFRAGMYGEGETGVTIVEFKRK